MDRRHRSVGVDVAGAGAVLKLGHRVVHRHGLEILDVLLRTEFLRMTAGAIRFERSKFPGHDL